MIRRLLAVLGFSKIQIPYIAPMHGSLEQYIFQSRGRSIAKLRTLPVAYHSEARTRKSTRAASFQPYQERFAIPLVTGLFARCEEPSATQQIQPRSFEGYSITFERMGIEVRVEISRQALSALSRGILNVKVVRWVEHLAVKWPPC